MSSPIKGKKTVPLNNQFQDELKEAIKEGKLSETFLSHFFQKHDTALTYFMKANGSKISVIMSELEKLGVTDSKMQDSCREILQIQEFKHQDLILMAFLCDLDAPDHNATMLNRFNSATTYGSLVVTTRTLFRGAGLQGNHDIDVYQRDQNLKDIEKRYDLYARGAFLVFVPKEMEKKLTELDLNPDILEKITLERAWNQIDEKPNLEGFRKLFLDKPTHKKLIYIAGHGGVGSPCGLTSDHYEEFLKWTASQYCQGLLVSSCYAGGKSGLLHLPKKDRTLRFQELPKGVSFPVFLRSIGDFSTLGGEPAEKNVRSLFAEVSRRLLNSPGGRTVARLRAILKEEEKGKSKKAFENLAQVYFPSHRDSPGGFRSVGEDGESSSLTYTRYRQLQLEGKSIKVSQKSLLQLSPASLECPLEFEGRNPILLSQIPGQAHHLLPEISLDEASPEKFLMDHAKFYKECEIDVTKTFFIATLKSQESQLNQIFVNLKSKICGYRKKDKYYLWSLEDKNSTPLEVSPLQFMLKWKKEVDHSCSDEEALRAATGGHQSEEEVLNHLEQSTFWGDQYPLHNRYEKVLKEKQVKTLSCDELQKLMKEWKLEEEEKISLLGYLLAYNESLACETFARGMLSPNSKDETGVPLIIHASRNHSIEFMKKLIARDADLNLQDPENLTTSLAIAIGNEDMDLFDLLLQQNSLNFSVKNKRGNPVYTRAILNLGVLKKCLKKDPHLDLNVEVTTASMKKMSLLAAAIQYSTPEVVQFLLDSGADPNISVGEYSPLAQAMISSDEKVIAQLLEHGANPYQKDSNDHFPIVEAIQRRSIHIVEKLLEKNPENIAPEVKTLVLLAALASGEEAKIRLVLKKLNPSFPKKLDSNEKSLFTECLKRFFLFGRVDLIREVVNVIAKDYEELQSTVLCSCLNHAPEVLLQLMSSSWDLPKLISVVIRKYDLSFSSSSKIITKAVELGVDLNIPCPSTWSSLPLQEAAQMGNLKLLHLLIEKGANPALAIKEIIEMGDLGLIKAAYKKGLKPTDSSQAPVLNQIARSDLSKPAICEAFKWLVEQGEDLNAAFENKTAFSHIIAAGDFELYNFCLTQGADTKTDMTRRLALAAKSETSGGEKIFKDLIEKGADINGSELNIYSTPFAVVAEYCSLELVQWCLDHGAKINPENPSFKITPLQGAANGGGDVAKSIFKLLVSKGGKLNQRGYSQSVPLIPIIAKGDLELLKFCFEKGAKLEDKELITKAFERALKTENPEISTELVQQGYTFSMAEWDETKTANFLNEIYCSGGHLMLKKAMEFSPSEKAIKIMTTKIQRLIVSNCDLKTLHLLESKGVTFNLAKILGSLKWSSFEEKENEFVIEILDQLEEKERVDFLTNQIHDIIKKENVPLMKYAFAKGVDPNFKIESWLDGDGHLIFKAIDTGNLEIVKIILAANPDLSVTHQDKVPQGYARKLGKTEIVKLIREHITNTK